VGEDKVDEDEILFDLILVGDLSMIGGVKHNNYLQVEYATKLDNTP